MHSAYALALGIGVVLFAQRGFLHARWLTLSLTLAWLLLVVFFRVYKSGKQRVSVDGAGTKLRFYVMTYVLKNLYQGMLFFLLPFYWRSVTFGADNQCFFVLIAACAFLATLDLVFDQVLMRWKIVASGFYLFTLFCAANVVIPALFPGTPSHKTLLAAAAIAHLGFWTLHISPARLFRPLPLLALALGTLCVTSSAYLARAYIPPASLWIDHAGVGPRLLEDRRLELEASRMHIDTIDELHAVTDLAVPAGNGNALVHRWRLGEVEVFHTQSIAPEATSTPGHIRLRSQLKAIDLPHPATGIWAVDVLTGEGQLVGSTTFEVIE